MTQEIFAQGLGIIGMALSILSFQSNKNSRYFIFQALSGMFFAFNFLLLPVPAYSAAFTNMANIARGFLLSKSDRKPWKLIVVLSLYTACLAVSLIFFTRGRVQIFLALLTFSSVFIGSCFMWHGDGKIFRYVQFIYISPAWLVHNFINRTLGGILCEIFAMASVVVSLIRYRKKGFRK